MTTPDTTIKKEEKTQLCPMYKVLLINDDHIHMDTVIHALIQVFHWDLPKSIKVMLDAHNNGVALLTIVPKERAELYHEQIHTFRVPVVIEPV